MAIIYRYRDLDDGIIKYVGIIHKDKRSLKERIKEHRKHDDWARHGNYIVEYIDKNLTRTDSEFIESHLIALYKTNNYYNKAKSDWGISKFIGTINGWIPYCEEPNYKELYNCLLKENERLRNSMIVNQNFFITAIKQHPYKIWQSADGKWHTHFKENGRDRIRIDRKTKEEIDEYICKFYEIDYKKKESD